MCRSIFLNPKALRSLSSVNETSFGIDDIGKSCVRSGGGGSEESTSEEVSGVLDDRLEWPGVRV